jgi:hypothetical protein
VVPVAVARNGAKSTASFSFFEVQRTEMGPTFLDRAPGTEFGSEEEALAAGALWAQANTTDTGIENCGMTYEESGGSFSFTSSVEGTHTRCQPLNASNLVPFDATADGGYHSHPDDPYYATERFSGQPGDPGGLGSPPWIPREGDLPWAQQTGFPFSLGTPGGLIIIYYPNIGNIGCQVFVQGGPAGSGTKVPVCN